MTMNFDVVIMGGAFSGASLALLLRREQPDLRVLLIERSVKFDRKVGEATTEVSTEFLTRRLGLTSYLAHDHLAKQGLRMWFTGDDKTPFEDCVEVGAKYQVRLPSYQIDRAKMDVYLLDLARQEGAEVWRPAKVRSVEGLECESDEASAAGWKPAIVTVERDDEVFEISARWVIDASGRAAVLARKFETFHRLEAHPTNAMWARFRGVADWDGHVMRKKFPEYANTAYASRAAATNHLTGYGWWCWIIPLQGGDYSAGLVYDSRIFTPPAGDSIAERLHEHLLSNPVGREIFRDATPVENDQKAFSNLPYYSDRLAGPGWQLVGDAAGFMDPLYSPGLDYCSWTVRCALGRIAAESRGESADLDKLNSRFTRSFNSWFRGLYLDKYYYLGDAELMSAAYWMDISLFFLGPVRESTDRSGPDLECLPFDGAIGLRVGQFMAFYNRRLSAIARKRMEHGCYGRKNVGWREMGDGFVPDARSIRPLVRGISRWLAAEWHAYWLPKKNAQAVAEQRSPAPAMAPGVTAAR